MTCALSFATMRFSALYTNRDAHLSGMTSKRYFTGKEAKDLLGVSTLTLRRWAGAGKLGVRRTAGNQRRYNVPEGLQNVSRVTKQDIIYVTVSTAKQRDDLERQTALCMSATQTTRSSATSAPGSISSATVCSPFWKEHSKAVSDRLSWPAETGSAGSSSSSSSGCLPGTAQACWFSTHTISPHGGVVRSQQDVS